MLANVFLVAVLLPIIPQPKEWHAGEGLVAKAAGLSPKDLPETGV